MDGRGTARIAGLSVAVIYVLCSPPLADMSGQLGGGVTSATASRGSLPNRLDGRRRLPDGLI
jgi:hypothetical protein